MLPSEAEVGATVSETEESDVDVSVFMKVSVRWRVKSWFCWEVDVDDKGTSVYDSVWRVDRGVRIAAVRGMAGKEMAK